MYYRDIKLYRQSSKVLDRMDHVISYHYRMYCVLIMANVCVMCANVIAMIVKAHCVSDAVMR